VISCFSDVVVKEMREEVEDEGSWMEGILWVGLGLWPVDGLDFVERWMRGRGCEMLGRWMSGRSWNLKGNLDHSSCAFMLLGSRSCSRWGFQTSGNVLETYLRWIGRGRSGNSMNRMFLNPENRGGGGLGKCCEELEYFRGWTFSKHGL